MLPVFEISDKYLFIGTFCDAKMLVLLGIENDNMDVYLNKFVVNICSDIGNLCEICMIFMICHVYEKIFNYRHRVEQN